MPDKRPWVSREHEEAAGPAASSVYRVRQRPDWSRVFARDRGWTGSDNTYSIPLKQEDGTPLTLFTFGDSFIGDLDPETGARSPDSIMINNAVGLLKGLEPVPEQLDIWLRPGAGSEYGTTFFVPPEALRARSEQGKDTAEEERAKLSDHIKTLGDSSYYWLQDGFVHDNTLWIFAMKVGPDPEGPEGFKFQLLGSDILAMSLLEDGTPDTETLTVAELPHHVKKDGEEIHFGAAVLAEEGTDEVFIYGLRKRQGAALVLAKVRKDSVLDFDSWRFLSAEGWSADPADSSLIAEGISSECSVSRMTFGPQAGQYALIYNRDGIEPYVEIRFAQEPEGPYGPPHVLWECPEVDEERGIYAYNAKAHPELSEPGKLLISYNVNTRKDAWHMKDGRIYRTRWLEIVLDELHLHPLLQSGAVLQRDRELALSGWTLPGEKVTLELRGARYEAEADARGYFAHAIPAQAAGGPEQLIFTAGEKTQVLDDVWFGDVYLAGGQSNMQLAFAESSRAALDRGLFADPLIRVCQIPQRERILPQQAPWDWTANGWSVLEGEALAGFSAVAAYAALRLRDLYPDVPVGIVGCYMGATSASCWTSAESLSANPEFDVYREAFEARIKPWADDAVFAQASEAFRKQSEDWQKRAAAYREEHPDAIEKELYQVLGPAPWPPPENRYSFMRPSGLYETMVKPLAGASFKAALFYQGESDVGHADIYTDLLHTMIRDWRDLFGELPLYQVQLPAYAPDLEAADDGAWGDLREAQRQASGIEKEIYHVVALDEGQLRDLHPAKKDMIGYRLAQLIYSVTERGVPVNALDCYVMNASLADGRIIVHLESSDTTLSYTPNAAGDLRDREVLKDSGFDLILPIGKRVPIATGQVAMAEHGVSQTIVITLTEPQLDLVINQPPGKVELTYGTRNVATAMFAATPKGPLNQGLYGTLEAFTEALEGTDHV